MGEDAYHLGTATNAALRHMHERPPEYLLVDDIDFNHSFRRRLIRELGDTDVTVIAAAREVPSDITVYSTVSSQFSFVWP